MGITLFLLLIGYGSPITDYGLRNNDPPNRNEAIGTGHFVVVHPSDTNSQRLLWPNAVRPHHLVVLVLDDMTVPDE
jgi:hypothetical protein